jgi:hypothetical protein
MMVWHAGYIVALFIYFYIYRKLPGLVFIYSLQFTVYVCHVHVCTIYGCVQ